MATLPPTVDSAARFVQRGRVGLFATETKLTVSEIDDNRNANSLARKLGVDIVLGCNVEVIDEVRQLTDDIGADVAIESFKSNKRRASGSARE